MLDLCTSACSSNKWSRDFKDAFLTLSSKTSRRPSDWFLMRSTPISRDKSSFTPRSDTSALRRKEMRINLMKTFSWTSSKTQKCLTSNSKANSQRMFIFCCKEVCTLWTRTECLIMASSVKEATLEISLSFWKSSMSTATSTTLMLESQYWCSLFLPTNSWGFVRSSLLLRRHLFQELLKGRKCLITIKLNFL